MRGGSRMGDMQMTFFDGRPKFENMNWPSFSSYRQELIYVALISTDPIRPTHPEWDRTAQFRDCLVDLCVNPASQPKFGSLESVALSEPNLGV